MHAVNRLMAQAYYGSRRWIARRNHYSKNRAGQQPFAAAQAKKILLLCMGLLGDTVMCLPAITEARRLFPKAVIGALVTPANQELLSPLSCVDVFYPYTSSAFPIRPANRRILTDLTARLREARFDLGIALTGDDYLPMLVNLGVPWRVSVENTAFSDFGTHRYSIGTAWNWGPKSRLGALRCLGLDPRPVEPRLAVAEQARQQAEKLLHESGIEPGAALIALHPFGRERHQWLPPQATAEIIRAFKASGANVAVTGGMREQQAIERGDYTVPPEAINLTGRLSVSQLCAIYGRSAVVISTDSGPLHIAIALNRPTVGLLRAIRPQATGWYAGRFEPVAWTRDASCGKRCRWDRCEAWPCRQMAGISPETVVKTAEGLLAKAQAPAR